MLGLALPLAVGAGALLTAESIAVLAEGALRPLPAAPRVEPKHTSAPEGVEEAAAEQAVARLFPPHEGRDPPPAPVPFGVTAAFPVPDLRLVAVIAADSAPHSWALARLGRNRRARVFRPGDRIGNAQVLAVLWREVVLERDGRRHSVFLFEHREASAPSRTGERWYRRLGPDRFAISRRGLERALKRMPRWRLPRVTLGGGRNPGLVLRYVPRGGPWRALGLRSGDAVVAVNGHRLDNPDAILGAYQRLRTAPRLEVVIARRGRRLRRTVLVSP